MVSVRDALVREFPATCVEPEARVDGQSVYLSEIKTANHKPKSLRIGNLEFYRQVINAYSDDQGHRRLFSTYRRLSSVEKNPK